LVKNIVPEVYPYTEVGLCGGGGAPPWEYPTKNWPLLFTYF